MTDPIASGAPAAPLSAPRPSAPTRASAVPAAATAAHPSVVWLAWLSLLALALPVLLVRVPPIVDYPNHLARLWLLMGGARLPPLSEFYAVDWAGASTNLGIDLVAAALAPLVAAEPLTRALLLLALVLPPLGALLLNRAVLGGWHPWLAGFGVLAWNWTLVAGFLNFQLSIGAALLLAAADRALVTRLDAHPDPRLGASGRGGWILAAWRVLASVPLLVLHPFGLFFFAALLCGLAWGGRLGAARDWPRRAGAALLAALPTLLPAALLWLLSPAPPGSDAAAAATGWVEFSLRIKLSTLSAGFGTYHRGVDLVMVGLLMLPVLWALWRGRLRRHAGLLVAAAGLVVLGVVVPRQVSGAYWVDVRFPVMALLCAAAALRPEPRLTASLAPGLAPGAAGDARGAAARRFALPVLALAMLSVSLARTGWISAVWLQRSEDTASVERVLSRLPVGADLLPVMNWPAWQGGDRPLGRFIVPALPAFWHLPLLAVPERRAFVPTLFTARGLQPMVVLPPRAEISDPQASVRSPHVLASPLYDDQEHAYSRYILLWRDRFSHVILINADVQDAAGPMPAMEGLELVADEGFARLYQVRRLPPATE